jgi:hypothetical protein
MTMAEPTVPAQLGDRVKCVITGFTGIVTCKTEWLNGCRRLGVQPEEVKDGKIPEPQYFDENQLEIVMRAIHKPLVLVAAPAAAPKESPTRGGPNLEGPGFRR